MANGRHRQSGDEATDHRPDGGGGVAGKRSLTDRIQRKASGTPAPSGAGLFGPLDAPPSPEQSDLSSDRSFLDSILSGPVQRKAEGETTEPVHAAAEAGTAGAGQSLPFLDQIQASFGAHDVTGVQSHTGAEASAAASGMGATAFATGNHVAFAGSPDLHTSAHEAAHVVQQRAGVHLKGGVGEEGDPYERHADAVADAVVRGESAESLLGPVSGGGGAGTAIQLKADDEGPLKPVAAKPAWGFDPKVVSFTGGGTQSVGVKNLSDEPQSLSNWKVVGDDQAFTATGLPGSMVAPGGEAPMVINFHPTEDMPQTAALVVEPGAGGFGTAPLAEGRVTLSGVRAGKDHPIDPNVTHGVPIKGTTPSGHANSVTSAMTSVHAAWNAVMAQQIAGVNSIHTIANKDVPKATSAWEGVLDDLIAEGLVLALGAVTGGLGGGLALAAWTKLEQIGLRKDGQNLAKDIAKRTLQLHNLIVNDVGRSVGAAASSQVRNAITESKGKDPSAAMREAFFMAQTKTLSMAYLNAVTTLNNQEGDFAAMEAQTPGLGFAALESYRNHIAGAAEAMPIAEIQSHKTAGMWMSFLAQQELGNLEDKGKHGANLRKNIYLEKNNHQEWRSDLARGVLDIHVIWDLGHVRDNPIQQVRKATCRGIHPDLKNILTSAPLKEFPIPIIVSGRVYADNHDGGNVNSEMRIGRNESGKVWVGAEPNKRSAHMLEGAGLGDALEGARFIMERHVDTLVLGDVE